MTSAQVGLWIDANRAVIVFAKSMTAHLVESRLHSSIHYYDNVINVLGTPKPVLIMGPGDAKNELQERMEQGSRWRDWDVQIAPSSSTSNRDILAELAERLQPQ